MLEVNLLVALLSVLMVVVVAWKSARQLSCTAFGSGRGQTFHKRICALGFKGLGQRRWHSLN